LGQKITFSIKFEDIPYDLALGGDLVSTKFAKSNKNITFSEAFITFGKFDCKMGSVWHGRPIQRPDDLAHALSHPVVGSGAHAKHYPFCNQTFQKL